MVTPSKDTKRVESRAFHSNAPSFSSLKPASEVSSRAKRANRREDTKHEVLLRSTLHKMGLRYRKYVSDLPGKPDIVFRSSRVAVFCDGDFWHGRNWRQLRRKLTLGSNSDYWIKKIGANIDRDRRNAKLLEDMGWHVVRVWETDIVSNPLGIAKQIAQLVRSRAAHQDRPHFNKRRSRK